MEDVEADDAGAADTQWFEALTSGDTEHHERTHSFELPELVNIEQGLRLLRWVLKSAPQPLAVTAANDLSSLALLARASRQIRAAVTLAMAGYYSEVGTLLRSAYEGVSLGRYLAKNDEDANEWLRKKRWLPDVRVQRWLDDWLASGSRADFQRYYRDLSAQAHPTAEACMPLVEADFAGDSYALALDTTFDEVTLRSVLTAISYLTLWACLAIENASVSPDVLPVEWLQSLRALAERIVPEGDWSHRDRDWDAERAKRQQLADRIRTASEMDELMRTHPKSWTNLKPDVPHTPNLES